MGKKHKRRSRALARRYGHFGMADVNKASAKIKQFANAHPLAAGAAIGATAGAIAAGTPASTAALVGAIAGVAAQEATGKR
jgi:hypothetical protein